MNFDVAFVHNRNCNFETVYYNNTPCIKGIPEMGDTEKTVSVISQDRQEVTPVNGLYPVKVGDYINIREKIAGTLVVRIYRVEKITDTEVIGGPC